MVNVKRGRCVYGKVGREESSRNETGAKIKKERERGGGRGDACVSVNGAWSSVARVTTLSFSISWLAGTRVPVRRTPVLVVRGASVLDRRLCRDIHRSPIDVLSDFFLPVSVARCSQPWYVVSRSP